MNVCAEPYQVAVMQGQDGQIDGSRYNAGYGPSNTSASAARYVDSVHEARRVEKPHVKSRFHVS